MARYTVPTATGAKRKTLYGKTRREVDEKLTMAKADRDRGLLFDANSLTVGSYLLAGEGPIFYRVATSISVV